VRSPSPNRRRASRHHSSRYFNLAADFKSTFATRVCKPWFVGVWDTVSSIGWYENPLQLPFTGDNPDIEIGRHAIAIDERRAFFRTNLWIPKNPPPYTRATSSRSGFRAFTAMSAGAIQNPRVAFPRSRSGAYAVPDPHAKMHESLTGFWWLAELLMEAAL
jgi:uncharacterized protein (DUF2235 family)